MDKADPVLIGHLCIGDLHLFPIDVDLALRGGECAGQHIHQGGFACAVFAQQPDDIPRGNGEIHMVHGAHRPKVHHDALHFYEHVPVLPSQKKSIFAHWGAGAGGSRRKPRQPAGAFLQAVTLSWQGDARRNARRKPSAMRGIPLSTEGIHAILKFKRAGRQAAGPFASSFYCIRIRSCRWSNARHRCRKRGRTRRSRQRRRRWRWRRRGSGTGRPPGWRRCTPRHTGGPRTDASPHG